MTKQDYNGWTNYETWNCKLWIDNDGSLSKELLIVGSRPDGGKTTFLAHTAQHMAQQLKDNKVVLGGTSA